MDLAVFAPSSVYIENRQGHDFSALPPPHERRGAFWTLTAPVLGIEPERYPRPGSLDWQLDAVARRDQRIAAANAPPTDLQAIVGDAVDSLREAVGKVVKVTKTQRAMDWLARVLRDGPVPQKEIEARAINDKIGTRPLKTAKARLKVQSTRKGRAAWAWVLPMAKPKEDGPA
jgi:hypothetical protein